MTATLNLYFNPVLKFRWQEASLLAARSFDCGPAFVRSLRHWIHSYLHHGKLPTHGYGQFCSSLLEDENVKEQIQLELLEKKKKKLHMG